MCLSLYLNNSLCYRSVCDWLQVCLSDCRLSIELIGSSLAARVLRLARRQFLWVLLCQYVCECVRCVFELNL